MNSKAWYCIKVSESKMLLCNRQVRRSRHQLYKLIDGDYYGFRDEEDGMLVKAEAKAEAHLRQKVGFHT